MDNEEIKKLLQELKESSDESSAVRSRVVRIHLDTPAEAERRRLVKEKEKAREERRRAEEQAKAEAEEEARRLEAERAAQEVVEEAKREAKAGFASDLEQDILAEKAAMPDAEETGEEPGSLNLSWDYEKPTLTSGFAKEEDFDLGSGKPDGRKSSADRVSDAGDSHAPSGAPSDARSGSDDFDSDEAEFRDGEKEGAGEGISGLPGVFGALSDRVLSFAGGIRKSVKEDLSRVRGKSSPGGGANAWPEEEDQDEDREEDEDTENGRQKHGRASVAGKNEPEETASGPDLTHQESARTDAERPGSAGKWTDQGAGRSKEMLELTSYWPEEEDDEAFSSLREADRLRERPVPGDDGLRNRTVPEDDDLPDRTLPERETPAKKEYGPDEEWKRRLEEPPKKKNRFQRAKMISAGLSSGAKKEKKPEKSDEERKEEREKARKEREEKRKARKELTEKKRAEKREAERIKAGKRKAEKAEAEKRTAEKREAERTEAEKTEAANNRADQTAAGPADAGNPGMKGADAVPDAAGTDAVPDAAGAPAGAGNATGTEPKAAGEAGVDAVLDAAGTDPGAAEGQRSHAREAEAEGMDAEEGAEEPSRKIEVIDLNENQNNKDAEVIPLVGNTGPLPDPSELKKARGKRHGMQGRKRHGGFFAAHRKQCIIAAAAAALVIAAVCIVYVLIGRKPDVRRELVEADEDLKVQVLQQPEQFVEEGDIQIRLKAPETIQSITVNGENVVIQQGRSVEFTYHAEGGTLDIMAVCTDKVRNAKVVLAYVDSQPPVVTIREEDGKIVFDAKDSESGVEAIYIGTMNGLSEIPQYEKYVEPLDADPEKEVSYYAQDVAGNRTTPVEVALTPAESISFEKEKYSLFPGVEQRVNLITTPAHAFVNNLKLEAENPKVLQVEGDMLIRGMAEGDTSLTASADGIAGVMAGVSVSSRKKVKVSAIGDCTLGTDENFSQNNSFNAYQALNGNDYFFEKVKGILGADDTTFANLEGTLTTESERAQKQFAFKGDPSYTQILKSGSIDAVNLANNHTRDYGDSSLSDTKKALDDAGITWCIGDDVGYRDVNGVLTAYIGIYALENGLETLPQVKSTIAEAKEKGAELIIVEFHWGAELVSEIDEYQIELAHTAVDEGANLVVGGHAHVLQGIEKYKGAYIVYGLGNFCFGGSANPTSYDTVIWQQTFTFTADGLESEDDISIIPCHISGDLSSNNYQPVPVSGDAAASIMQTIDSLSGRFGQSYSQYMVDGTLWTDSGQQ